MSDKQTAKCSARLWTLDLGLWTHKLNAAFFTRAAAIMRNRRHVFDGTDFKANRLNRADRGFATRARTFDADFNFFHSVRHCLTRRILRDLLRSVSRAFARAFETNATGARPTDEISLHVGDGDLRVVESGKNVLDADEHIFCVLRTDDFFG